MSEQNLPLPPELDRLSVFIDSNIECLVGPSSELRSIALHAAKHVFDWALKTERASKPHLGALLSTLAETAPPQTRSQARRAPMQKTQRKINIRETPLPSLFIEGMNIDQIWQQLDLRATRVCENLQILLGDGEDEGQNASLDGEDSDDDESEDNGEVDDEDDPEEMDVDEDEDENVWEELSNGEEDCSSTAEDVVVLRDEISESDEDEDEDEGPPTSMLDVVRAQKLCSSGPYSQGLDDGFFDLATFNAETTGAETKVHKEKLTSVSDEDSTEESGVDLFASVNDSVIDGVEDGLELFYNDFFDPPSQARDKDRRSSKVRFHEQVSVKKIRAVGKGIPVSFIDDEDSDEEEENDSGDDDSSS